MYVGLTLALAGMRLICSHKAWITLVNTLQYCLSPPTDGNFYSAVDLSPFHIRKYLRWFWNAKYAY
jgi:hypothetical protein